MKSKEFRVFMDPDRGNIKRSSNSTFYHAPFVTILEGVGF